MNLGRYITQHPWPPQHSPLAIDKHILLLCTFTFLTNDRILILLRNRQSSWLPELRFQLTGINGNHISMRRRFHQQPQPIPLLIRQVLRDRGKNIIVRLLAVQPRILDQIPRALHQVISVVDGDATLGFLIAVRHCSRGGRHAALGEEQAVFVVDVAVYEAVGCVFVVFAGDYA